MFLALLRWMLIAIAGLLSVLVVACIAIAALGISVSAEPWRHQLSDAMSRAIGREVRFEGTMQMQISLTPSIRVEGITVANSAGFSSPFFASLGQAMLRLELLALLRGEVRVQELSAQGVKVHLERNQHAQVNWLFQLARSADTQAAPIGDSQPPVRLVAIDRIELKDLLVDYTGGPGLERHVFTLDQLHGEGGDAQPLTVKMQGTVEKSFPYTLSVIGGTLSALSGEVKPWPVDFTLEFAGTVLHIGGSVRPNAARTSANLSFGLGADHLSNLERLLQVHLPPVGATGLSGQVIWENGVLDIRELRGSMGQSTLAGQIKVDITQAIPRVNGEFDLPVFDVTPFQTPPATANESKSEAVDLIALKEKHQTQEFEFRELAWVEADLMLKVERWIGLPGDVRDSALQVSVHHGVLKAPLSATVADVPLVGVIDLDAAAATPEFRIALGADQTELGQLARLLTGARGVKGRLGHFLLRFAATGKNLPALVKSLQMQLDVTDGELTYGNVEGGKPVEMRLDKLAIALPPAGRLNGKIRGALLGEKFAADFKGGDLPTLSEQIQWPVEIVATGSGATISVQGRVAAPEKTSGTDVTIQFNSAHAGSVARWLGLSPKSAVPVSLSGRVRVESDAWRLSDLQVQLGKTKISGDFARVDIEHQPLVQAKLRVENLELAELESMLPPPKPGPSEPVIELPILPHGVDLTDADVDVAIKRIALPPAPVTDVTFTGKIRDGKMQASPFSAHYAGTDFSGALALDLRRQIPEATAWVAALKPDIGHLLRTLGVISTMEIKADLLQLQLLARGQRLGEMLQQSALIGTVESGFLALGEINGKGGVHVTVNSARVEAQPNEPVHVDIDGLIDQTPVQLRIASGSSSELLHASSHVPFSIKAEFAETTVDLSGKVALPISQQEVELQLSVSGANVSSLDQLARASLPHWGPYSLRSQFRVSNSGYTMPGLTLKVGSSELNGKGSVLITGERPKIDVQLAAPKIQLDDFKLDDWALFAKKPQKEDKKLSEQELRKLAKEATAMTEEMLSLATLKRQDVKLAVDVSEVQSGKDRLGSGSLRAELTDGQLAFGPAEVNVPGGSAKLWLGYRPSAAGIALDAKVRVDHFDYGVLARRLKPESDLQGLFSLQLDLKSQTPSLQRAMQNGDGRLDFAVWPRNMPSGIFDLWAVNLLVALIPAVDPVAESKVNCAVGRFDLKKGILTDDAILLDTSRMRVIGKGRVDFDAETLAFTLVPKPKKAQFFSLSTPVDASGKLTDPKIGVSAGAVAGTTVRLLTSVFTTPFERLFGKEIPRDGNDVCDSALQETREPH